jgi:signal transduction histidine kinase
VSRRLATLRRPDAAALPDIVLDEAGLDRLYPFHVRVNADFEVVKTGRVIERVLPTSPEGRRLDEVFTFERPSGVTDFASLGAASDRMCFLTAIERPELRLKGEILMLPGHAVLLTVPWLSNAATLDVLDLTITDFALGDATPDLLFLIETKDALLNDAKALTQRLKTARDAALAASHAKTEFLANMSHELRTPLNAIIGFSEAMELLGAETIPPQFLGYIGDIHTSGRLLLDLVNDLLDLSRIELGKLAVESSEFELSTVLADIVRTVSPLAEKNVVAIQVAPELQALRVRADEGMLRQVFLNLVGNAIKFNRPGGSVSIDVVDVVEGGIEIVVSDTGIGVDPAAIPQLFQPFRQENSQIARTYGGTGLGLSIVKQLIELHSGSVEMTSAPGVGSTLRVRLPASRVLRAPAVTSPA